MSIFQRINKERIERDDPTKLDTDGFYAVFPLGLEDRNLLLNPDITCCGIDDTFTLPPTLNDRPFIDCMGDKEGAAFIKKLYWTQIFIAMPGTGMQLHHDNLYAHVWGVQLQGKKEFVFCPPENWKEIGVESKYSEASPLDAFNPDFEKFPNFDKAECVHVVANPGDLVYWPSQWWHQSYIPAQDEVEGIR